MNDNELRELRIILNALANQHGLLQWVNAYAVGKNEGGLFVSLFHDRLQYRVCTVYAERFRELPAFIRDNLPADGDGIEISTDRTVLERKGLLRPCTPFQIARYSVGDDDKAAWRFSGVVRVAKPQAEAAQGKPQEPSPSPPPPEQPSALFEQFHALGHDLYGVSWADVCQRNVQRISGGATENSQDLTPEQIQKLISGMMKIKSKRGPEGSPQSARQHVAAQPNYAG